MALSEDWTTAEERHSTICVSETALLKEFLESRESPATAEVYERWLTKMSASFSLSGKGLLSATRDDVAEFVESCRRQGYRTNSVYTAVGALGSFQSFVRAKGVEVNASLAGFQRPRHDRRRVTHGLPLEDVEQVESAARSEADDLALLVGMLLRCGLAVSEAISLDASDIGLGREGLVARVTRNRGRVELVPIPAPIEGLAKAVALAHAGGPLFRGREGGRLLRQVAWRSVVRVGRKAGLSEPLSPRRLRVEPAPGVFEPIGARVVEAASALQVPMNGERGQDSA